MCLSFHLALHCCSFWRLVMDSTRDSVRDSTWLVWLHNSNLEIAWDLKVEIWDLFVTCTCVTYSHIICYIHGPWHHIQKQEVDLASGKDTRPLCYTHHWVHQVRGLEWRTAVELLLVNWKGSCYTRIPRSVRGHCVYYTLPGCLAGLKLVDRVSYQQLLCILIILTYIFAF